MHWWVSEYVSRKGKCQQCAAEDFYQQERKKKYKTVLLIYIIVASSLSAPKAKKCNSLFDTVSTARILLVNCHMPRRYHLLDQFANMDNIRRFRPVDIKQRNPLRTINHLKLSLCAG